MRPLQTSLRNAFSAALVVTAACATTRDASPNSGTPPEATDHSEAGTNPPDARFDATASNDASAADGASGASVALSFAASTYTLYASIGDGVAHLVQLDTGSNGLYVPRAVLGPSATVSTTETCGITYVSSGTSLAGHTAIASVALLGSQAAGDVSPPPATAPMSLCAIDDPSWKGGMMGVGFGRGNGSSPATNVLLNMKASPTAHAGYLLSTHPIPQVTIGLTSATLAGFAMSALDPSPGVAGDWVATSLRGCLSLPDNTAFPVTCGGLLVDTGIDDCLVWGITDKTLGGTVPTGSTTVPSGTKVRIATPADGSRAIYEFVVGQGNDTPAHVSLRTASAFSINTGRALLVDYDYAFDATEGQVGFRRSTP